MKKPKTIGIINVRSTLEDAIQEELLLTLVAGFFCR